MTECKPPWSPHEMAELLEMLARAADRCELSYSETANIARNSATMIRYLTAALARANSPVWDEPRDREQKASGLPPLGNFDLPIPPQERALMPQSDEQSLGSGEHRSGRVASRPPSGAADVKPSAHNEQEAPNVTAGPDQHNQRG